MAVVDMPLEELKLYKGTNPCPEDFDQYWQNGLNEMYAIDPDINISPADFRTNYADCFDLYFTGVGGARIYAKLLKPKKISGKCPAIVEFHGYSASSGDWFTKLPYVANGFVVVSMDCRGQGGKSEDVGGVKGSTLRGHLIRGLIDKPENLLYRQIFLDAAQLASILINMDEVDETRVGAMGGSQGGGLTIACAGLEPRIKRLVPVFPFLSDYKRCWDIDLGTCPYDELKDYFRKFDPHHTTKEEVFRRLGYIDVQNFADRIKGSVLIALTLRDDICPPSTQFAVYNKIVSEKKMFLYPDFGHENLPGFADRTFQFLADI